MTATAASPAPEKKPVSAQVPLFERITGSFAACDGHASGTVAALATMITPSGALLTLCGNCARKAGWDHVMRDPEPPENRSKGSSN